MGKSSNDFEFSKKAQAFFDQCDEPQQRHIEEFCHSVKDKDDYKKMEKEGDIEKVDNVRIPHKYRSHYEEFWFLFTNRPPLFILNISRSKTGVLLI